MSADNIKVVVKVRPLISRELDEKSGDRWRVKNNTLIQLDSKGRETETYFTYDKVYDKHTKTQEVYDDVARPIVEAAIAGFNGTIFAYGQTSSGKTYTMTGTEDSPGIIPLAVLNLFDEIKKIPNRDFLVRVAYIEIYNETLKDLFNVDKKNIKIHETYTGLVKVNVEEKVTASPGEVLEFMKQGEVNRTTGATNMNELSSRSHSIFQITIESREHVEGEDGGEGRCVNVSQLNLVDLAGSERTGQSGATGLRFKEGTLINKSLSCLALVIKQLAEDPNKYVNFRDSKLTRLLQNSLGGNSKTSIVCAVTPASVEETVSTLQFANRAKAIKNKPEVNVVANVDATMIQELTRTLSRLQAELAAKKNLLETKNTTEQTLQKKIEGYQKMILNGFGERGSVGARRKIPQMRRVTISALHHIEEEPAPDVPRFCTPALKYNPMAFSSAFVPIQSSKKLAPVPEEARMITPPPPVDGQLCTHDEIIELDSDDDANSSAGQPCSPYHKCYTSSKTLPCVLRKTAKLAEKNLQDIVELTDREKMYTPNVVELLEKQEQSSLQIIKLQNEISVLLESSKEKDAKIDELNSKITKAERELETIASAKLDLETKFESKCKEYDTQLTDWEVSYETPVKKAKTREQELLALLEEQTKKVEEIDHNRMEALFDSRLKPDDLFANLDEDSSSRSTPVRLSRGRDSSLSREHSAGEEEPSRPSSASAAARRRRQTTHDQHRAALVRTPIHDSNRSSSDFNQIRPDILDGNTAESTLSSLRGKVAALAEEVAALTERNRELDEECEICAQYMRNEEQRANRLRARNTQLESQIAELSERLRLAESGKEGTRPALVHASVNTDADWANLHTVVVDRMSFDAEVGKDKKLTQTIEQLRYNKQELKHKLAKMKRALYKGAAYRGSRQLEATQAQLAECERERDILARKLRDARHALEKLQEQTECGVGAGGAGGAGWRKRQSLHDQNRSPRPRHGSATEVGDDLLNKQVERDDGATRGHAADGELRQALDKVLKEKAALENQLLAATCTPLANPTMFVATGSAIVQNQQITDAMKENQKLKKINAKLITICKKRGKGSDANRENEEPSDLG